MKKLSKFIFILSLFSILPVLVFAQPNLTGINYGLDQLCSSANGIRGIICQLQGILSSILPILISLGVIYFIWGVVQYVIGDGEEAKKTGKDRMIYGIIGFAVILGLWGFVNILVGTFGLNATAPSLDTVAASSETCPMGNNFGDFLKYITCLINSAVIPLIFALATVMFIWGVVQFFIIGANEEAKREQGKQFIIWGVIALTVMISIWGLVGIVGGTFNLNTSVLPEVRPK